MQHGGTQPIETSRLLLRQFTLEDSSEMFVNWSNSPIVCQYLTWFPHANEEETKQILEIWCGHYAEPTFYQWAVERKEDKKLIGSISLEYNGFNKEYAGWMPGYCYGEAFWGQGYATEALDALVEYFFSNTQEDTLFCVHHTDNPRSGKTMKKVGFQYITDATHPGKNGEIIPTCYYKIKKEDYNGR